MTTPPASATYRHLLVAGAAGGVGTTTVAALLAAAHVAGGGSVALVDQSGGSLAARLPTRWTSPGVADLTLHDRGAHPGPAAASLDDLGGTVLVVVASSTPAAVTLLPRVLAQVSAGAPERGVQLVLVQVHGRYRSTGADRAALPASTTVLPRDDHLAADGPIDWSLLSPRTRAVVLALSGRILATPS